MKFKLKRIDWYIIKQFLGTYIFAIALIIAISVVFDINEKIDKFLSPDVPLKAIVFDYYMNFIPYFANLFSPLFTFIAVIFFTSKLADNSEVIAMLASGMSFRRLMLPYAISAGIIALSTFALNAYIIPPANATRIDFQNKYIKNKKDLCIFRFMKTKSELRDRLHSSLNDFTEFLCIAIWIGQTNNLTIIRDAEHQCAAESVGKRTYTFAPAFWAFYFQRKFFVIFCCFTNQIFYIHCGYLPLK